MFELSRTIGLFCNMCNLSNYFMQKQYSEEKVRNSVAHMTNMASFLLLSDGNGFYRIT